MVNLDSEGGTVRVWDATTGRCLHKLDGHPWRVTAVVVSDRLVASGDDQSVLVWDVRSGRLLHRWSDHDSKIQSLALSPDSRVLYDYTHG